MARSNNSFSHRKRQNKRSQVVSTNIAFSLYQSRRLNSRQSRKRVCVNVVLLKEICHDRQEVAQLRWLHQNQTTARSPVTFSMSGWRESLRLSLFLVIFLSFADAQQPLQQQIHSIAQEAHGKVSVACSLPGTILNCDLDPTAHPPMQSVFKLPLVLTVLDRVEQGKFSLDQPIPFRTSDLIFPKPYSPLQDKYPQAGVEVSLRDLLQMTVSLSDNTAADILLRLVGGPRSVESYISKLGVTGFRLRDDERALHRDD